MYTIKDFKGWLQDICSRKIFEEIIEVVRDDDDAGEGKNSQYERRFSVRIYTGNNSYGITAIERDNEQESYLGCIASARKPRAGEDWTRGNDLPDGRLAPETWQEIKDAIISYELVRIAEKQRQVPEECKAEN